MTNQSPQTRKTGQRPGIARVAFLFLMTLGWMGCQRNEPITRVVVDADQSGIQFDETEEPKEGRMVVAIHESAQSTWTLKINAETSLVNSTEAQWLDFFRGVTFDSAGLPQWELPDGWSKVDVKPGPFAPFARIQIAEGLTISVSRLPGGFDMLSNINRWRRQLSLPPATEVDLKPISGTSKTAFQMFDATGLLSSGGMTPPFAGGGAGGMTPPPAQDGDTVKYDAPAGWEVGQPSQIVAVRLSRVDGDHTAQITVTNLPADLNQWDQVARNWAGELRLESLSAEALDQRTRNVEVDSLSGKSIRFIELDDEITRGLIGIRVDDGRQAWFIKLAGEKKLVAESEEVFFQFVDSIRFQ